jgi:cell division protease FtsH
LPLLLLVAFFVWSGRMAQRSLTGGIGGISGFGRSPAKIIEAQRPTTRFADVAGYEGAKLEVSEVVDFLRDPVRYAASGAKGPRGVIMVGPPGTGKTLLARAVAGGASVPFLSVTGSAFVEMFVGVGASRVRDLFAEARKRAPSIIFIDEIDVVGRKRGFGGIGGRARADIEPVALRNGRLRPEQRDRGPCGNQSPRRAGSRAATAGTVRPPGDRAAAESGRTLRHPRGAHRRQNLAPDVDLAVIARGTPGFSGADLANLVNEGAINAVRANRTFITATDLGAARDCMLLGRRETSNALLPEERHSVAVHESGHALLAAICEHADPVAKVTILPAGMTLGATEQLPEAESHLYSEAYLTDLLAVRLGGRAAELVVFDLGSTGAANDLAGVTELATKMVTEFGLSPRLGPVGYPVGDSSYLAITPREATRAYSEQTQRVIDEEFERLLRAAEDFADVVRVAPRPRCGRSYRSRPGTSVESTPWTTDLFDATTATGRCLRSRAQAGFSTSKALQVEGQ